MEKLTPATNVMIKQNIGQVQIVQNKEIVKAFNTIPTAQVVSFETPKLPERTEIKMISEREPASYSINKEHKVIIFSAFKPPKILKVSSFMKPTASMVSLEKAFIKYGKSSLARGERIEKIYRNLAKSSGLSLEFPAGEFIRGGKRK